MNVNGVLWILGIAIGGLIAAAALRASRRTQDLYVRVGARWLMRARLQGHARNGATSWWLGARRAWERRRALAYLQPPWQNSIPMSNVKLSQIQQTPAQRKRVQVAHGYEIDFSAPRRRFAQLAMQAQVASVAVIGLAASFVLGRHNGHAIPHGGYVAGDPSGVGLCPEVKGRWYLANLDSPNTHAFETATPAPIYNTYSLFQGHTDTNASGTHTNSLATHTNQIQAHVDSSQPVHVNTPGTHSNTPGAPHSNTPPNHTNVASTHVNTGTPHTKTHSNSGSPHSNVAPTVPHTNIPHVAHANTVLVPHSNAPPVLAHTNIDTRPFPGPY